MSLSSELALFPISGIPNIEEGADLAATIDRAIRESGGGPLRGGALAVCQKVVSKAEGRVLPLAEVVPSQEARRLAVELEKDPRQVEVVLRESLRIVRRGPGVLICETRHGFVCANAGVDLSNAPQREGQEEVAVLLPEDCDASARHLRKDLEALGHGPLAVIVTDTFGRPWREALVDVALGCAGIDALRDCRGESDLAGRTLQVTTMASVDQLAAAAGFLMGKNAGVPAVWIEGQRVEMLLHPRGGDGGQGVRALLRDPATDLFR